MRRRTFLALTALTLTGCPNPNPELEPFEDIAEIINWMCYAPTNFNPEVQRFPSQSSIRSDLTTLYNYGIEGIVTYASDNVLSQVPRIAREVGMGGVIMGIWNPKSNLELNAAINANENVSAYCIGNEHLDRDYTLTDLQIARQTLLDATGKPISTAEERGDYTQDRILDFGDFLFPNIHPYWDGITSPRQAAEYTAQRFAEIQNRRPGKLVLIKETGLPTAGNPGVSEQAQQEFYQHLRNQPINFCYFEAFDQPWKNSLPVEPHWGLFRQNRNPKPAANDFI